MFGVAGQGEEGQLAELALLGIVERRQVRNVFERSVSAIAEYVKESQGVRELGR